MSGQPSQSQRMRKTVSPGAGSKQGPIRAIVPLSLMQTCSPTRCLKTTASPTRCLKTTASPSHSPPVTWASGDAASKVKTRLSPDNRISPSESSQSPSPICRGGDGKSSKMGGGGGKSSVSPSFLRRTASVDTIYLLGQWQRDALYLSYCGRLMMDRATQTPDEFEEADRRPSQKKGSAASNETLEMKYIRQRLQRGPVGGRPHPPSSGGSTSPPSVPSFAPPPRAHPIPIPDIPKLIPRMRSSVEGLNQEIERIVLREISTAEGDDNDRPMAPTPEGHRAPAPHQQQQSVDTQTPLDRSSSNSSTSSGSPPLAPLLPMDSLSRPSSTEGSKGSGSPDIEGTHKLATSPHINKFLAREPPDGCEKVKIAEETRSCEYQHQELSKPSMHHFVLLPSQRSAFDPLCKTCGALSNGDVPQNTMLQ
ncbi:hypothetical protein JTE90_016356 [Oedothorax gibbosus]|uniref:Uncharacterized protein n=1 Tax=Oedothorax gibbosus TaxID=931172 RepID=A0AAV6U828_9ARAC|nr:hypothetical protein JTE90_016356 [Oedothorax gibbosus]